MSVSKPHISPLPAEIEAALAHIDGDRPGPEWGQEEYDADSAHIEVLRAYIAGLVEQLETLQAAAKEIEQMAFHHYADWMHFHEIAMADPFKAETEAREFAERVMRLAISGLGSASAIEVSSPATKREDSNL